MAFYLKCKPCEYTRVSQPFKAGKHKGIDLVNKKLMTNTPIVAAAAGTVVCAGGKGHNWHWSYGNQVAIYHGNGNYTNYGHLSKIKTKVGKKVKAGDIIGYMGHTGNCVPANINGTHLHFEVHKGKKWARVNPWPYIQNAGKQETTTTGTYTLNEDMNVRAGASVHAKKVGTLKKGDKVTGSLVKRNGETWVKIANSKYVCKQNAKGHNYIR